MIADSYIVPECAYGPESFGGLMVLYESNYLLLNNLLGSSWPDHKRTLTSKSASDYALYLNVESASRYTQLLRMTYLFDEAEGMVADPDLFMRVYHDARMVEVVSWAGQQRHNVLRALESRVTRQMDKCWRKNIVLSKWLNFLLDSGHSFADRVPQKRISSRSLNTA